MKPTNTETMIESAELQAVLTIQTAYQQAESHCNALQALISEQEQKIAALTVSKCSAVDLQAERENVLAALAAGQITEEEANSQEQSINQREQTLNDEDAQIDRQRGAAKGLTRQLQNATAEVQELESKKTAALLGLLLAEAETACADYVAAAFQVRDRFIQLTALGRKIAELSAKHGNRARRLNGNAHSRLLIPAFFLPQCDAVVHPNHPSVVVSAERWGYGNAYEDAVAKEMQRLSDMGVSID